MAAKASEAGIIDLLIDKMHELDESYNNTLKERAANRRSLRDLMDQSFLSSDQEAMVLEKYPYRKEKDDEGEPEGEE